MWSIKTKIVPIIGIVAISMSAGFFRNNMAIANAPEKTTEKPAEFDSGIEELTEQIARMNFGETRQLLDSHVKNKTYLSMRMFYRDGRVICSGNDFFGIDANAERAFRGETVIGSPLWSGVEEYVFRIYKPVDQNRILVVTFPGQHISSM